MNHDYAYTLIDNGFAPVIPGNPKIRELVNHKGRYFSLSSLPRMHGICKWCYENVTKTSRHLYCSTECNLSAEMFCYPQGIWSRRFLLQRQGEKCNKCETDLKCKYSEIDHVIPIYKGGTALGSENLQALCGECHTVKTKEDRK